MGIAHSSAVAGENSPGQPVKPLVSAGKRRPIRGVGNIGDHFARQRATPANAESATVVNNSAALIYQLG
jgi:hypothetical protein